MLVLHVVLAETYQTLSSSAHAEGLRVAAAGPIMHHLVHEHHLSCFLWLAAQLALTTLCKTQKTHTHALYHQDLTNRSASCKYHLPTFLYSLTIWVLVRQPGVLDVFVVFVAPLDTLLSTEVLVRASALLRVAHLVVKSGTGAVSAPVGRPDTWQKQQKWCLTRQSWYFQRSKGNKILPRSKYWSKIDNNLLSTVRFCSMYYKLITSGSLFLNVILVCHFLRLFFFQQRATRPPTQLCATLHGRVVCCRWTKWIYDFFYTGQNKLFLKCNSSTTMRCTKENGGAALSRTN